MLTDNATQQKEGCLISSFIYFQIFIQHLVWDSIGKSKVKRSSTCSHWPSTSSAEMKEKQVKKIDNNNSEINELWKYMTMLGGAGTFHISSSWKPSGGSDNLNVKMELDI